VQARNPAGCQPVGFRQPAWEQQLFGAFGFWRQTSVRERPLACGCWHWF